MSSPGTMQSPRLALGLWLVLATVLFMVRFDWRTKQVAQEFAVEQLARSAQGRPTVSINHGFRPRLRVEAQRAAAWSGLVFATGVAATAWASRSRAAL
ncbi:MAG: hypothetical protein ABI665_17050 [Vicinamibacterales bacterium]